ncbi:CmcJ/NvfI family oxidoreductase [Variovorax sp. E3]|uniref:CmcJ/NvfI family oxidoreductase n=1 Tax=Variovorax sp. E3 TaxID=1914993 RepID=UPI0027DD0BAA|nr:CmcJ/NvfI family oxidoreductase [Variovorax sp. E3]
MLPDADEAASVRRYCIVNIWRSIKGPVLDTPLAVCDARSVMARDLVNAEVRYPRRTGEIYLATHSPSHRWSYFSAMDRHEALVFKQYDSQLSGVSRYTPHAAFDHPDAPADAPLRESIEARCLVVFE